VSEDAGIEPRTAATTALAVRRSRNCPGFDPSILRHSGILGAADEAELNKVLKNPKKFPLKKNCIHEI
jgi:hypothetical protein